MRPRAVLILGGTSEARALASSLAAAGCVVTSSLAGRVANPALPQGQVRIGGFGGVDGLAEYLRRTGPDAVVDATHPFAATITSSAATACAMVGVPIVRLSRPGWSGHPDASRWTWVESHDDAAVAAQRLGSRVFLTTGRSSLPHFVALSTTFVLVRLVEPTAGPLPEAWQVVYSRGPYTLDGERRLMTSRAIDVLVTKDSGGPMTEPKLTAAAHLAVPVVIVGRPPTPVALQQVQTVDQVVRWVTRSAGNDPDG